MPIKYFCDECGVEVLDPSGSLNMTGKIYCAFHLAEAINKNSPAWTYKKKWDGDRFPKLNDNNSMTDCNHNWVIVVISPFTQRCTKCGMER